MNASLATIEDIFADAVEIAADAERRAFVEAACAGRSEVRQEVERLLAWHVRAGSFLEQPAADLALELTADLCLIETRKAAPRAAVSLDFLEPPAAAGSLGQIGPYAVQSVLGRGGMGIVLKAFDSRLERTVAVKVLTPQLAADKTARRRFLRGGRAAAAIAHPNVATIYNVDDKPLTYLVMEFINGTSLGDLLDRDGPLPPQEIVRLGGQIASGLAAAHARRLIHRDIKPANILLSKVQGPRPEVAAQKESPQPRQLDAGPWTAKLTDFGLARAIHDVDLTRTGQVTGTPQYMSPEQAQGLPLDARSDLFSLGSVLYAMGTGRSPFQADSALAVMRRLCDEPHQPIRELNPDIPVWLSALIDRLLAKRPEDRIPSAGELVERLAAGPAADLNDRPDVQAPPELLAPSFASLNRTYPPERLFIAIAVIGLAGFLLASLGVWIDINDKHDRKTNTAGSAASTAVIANDRRGLVDVQPMSSQEGPVKLVGSSIVVRGKTTPEKRTPDDLHPGDAQERWKKTPAYQKWQREAGQFRLPGEASP